MACKMFREELNYLQLSLLLSITFLPKHRSADEIVVLRFNTNPSYSLGQIYYNFVANPGKHFGRILYHVT
jgi:hypothetical protein